MSVQVNTYVLYGALLDYKPFRERFDELEPYMDNAFKGIHHHEGVCILFDGMCGKYVAIGRVVAKTGNHEGFNAPVSLSPSWSASEEVYLRKKISALANADVVLGYHVISHYR